MQCFGCQANEVLGVTGSMSDLRMLLLNVDKDALEKMCGRACYMIEGLLDLSYFSRQMSQDFVFDNPYNRKG